ncbi:helix-turn-helix transcriptional regulator [Frigoribacterium sp. CG_9.8]|uniref:helix-turn-helix domain-containing protein n=1 Tax=Frigoribacterium sp. CG_9.8 TaxID=2787733 RepID=UPI0018CBCDC2|nr:helix-turn-helix transcriptional regulator [Frigoribacterium sp. CG_9.8]MBG6107383.1 transcriptional regulator with XRE-family HTH domain [Frigoribacterium sp. CG_9.8]
MTDRSAGEALAEARKAVGWSQAKLAETLGFSTVLISKIESGVRAPSRAFIQALSSHLPEKVEAVQAAAAAEAQSDKRKTGSLKIVEAMKLAKKNGERANQLKSRVEYVLRQADEVAKLLDEKVKEFDREVVEPFSRLASRVSDLPEDVIVPADIDPSRTNPEFAEALTDAQLKTSKSIFSLLGAGVLGSGAGAAVGAGAATATYMTVASIATASTGAAISGLSGAAATSATLAAIGGGSLAAGGLGIAGGTALLTGIVALPVIAAVAGAMLASGGRIYEKQKSVEREIEQAESEFDANEIIVRRFVARAMRINEILTVALLAGSNHRRAIEHAMPGLDDVAWSEQAASTKASVRRTAEIVLACLSVLSLPIGMNLKQGAPKDAMNALYEDEESVPKFAPELEEGSEPTNEFIDYAIEQTFSQVAR